MNSPLLQNVLAWPVFQKGTGTVHIAKICIKKKSLENVIKMLLLLEGLQESIPLKR